MLSLLVEPGAEGVRSTITSLAANQWVLSLNCGSKFGCLQDGLLGVQAGCIAGTPKQPWLCAAHFESVIEVSLGFLARADNDCINGQDGLLTVDCDMKPIVINCAIFDASDHVDAASLQKQFVRPSSSAAQPFAG